MASAQKVTVITGANKGIGYAAVRHLAKAFDGDVILTSRDKGRGEAALDKLKSEHKISAKFHQLDVDDKDSVIKFRDFIEKTYGGLDVLVNNAGIYPRDKDVPLAERAEQTIKTNYYSLKNMCEQFFPLLRKDGRVVNVSSQLGQLSHIPSKTLRKRFKEASEAETEAPDAIDDLANDYLSSVKEGKDADDGWGTSAYNVSKALVTALSIYQQKKLDNSGNSKDIIVNAMHPGHVKTDMGGPTAPVAPDTAAEAIVFLATLPAGTSSPRGEFVWYDKSVRQWDE